MSKMNAVGSWFQQEVWRWRSGAAVVWSALLLPPILFIYLLAANFDILHPISWITSSLSGIFSPSNWLYIIVLGIAVIVVAITNAKHFTPVSPVLCCRWDYVSSVLRPGRILHALGHSLAGALITWSLTALHGGRTAGFSQPCSQDSTLVCLNERHVFVVVTGAAMGWWYSLTFFIGSKNYLVFPPVQQSNFFRVKSSLLNLFLSSGLTVLKSLRVLCPVYYLFGGYVIKQFILSHMSISIDDSNAVDSVFGMLDIGLLLQAALCGILVHALCSLTTLLQSVYHTLPLMFPVEAQFEQDRGRCLQDALAPSAGDGGKHSLVQHLGYQDLYLLSKHSPDRRAEIFSLSQLGGHPLHWTAVSQHCQHLLDTFCTDVGAYNTDCSMMPQGPIRQLSGDKMTQSGGIQRSKGTDASGLSHTMETTQAESMDFKPAPKSAPPKPRPFPYFTAPLPDAISRKMFSNAQLIVWAVQALSYLVSASYTEDRFGVVQKSLTDILACLLNTHEAVEKHMKIASVCRSSRDAAETPDVGQIRFAVRAALKTAIYRIVTVFQHHLDAVPLSVDHKRRLGQFQEYRE